MNPEIKKVISESVIRFLNEARFDKPKKIPVSSQPELPKDISINIKGKNKEPIIHPSFEKPQTEFQANPPGLNERQLQEIEDIREELEKALRD
jgi:hypothetical protein